MGGGGQKKNRSTFGDITNAGAHPGKQVRLVFFSLSNFPLSSFSKEKYFFRTHFFLSLSLPTTTTSPFLSALPCEMRRDISRTAGGESAAAREVLAAGEQQRPKRRRRRWVDDSCGDGLQFQAVLAPPVPPAAPRRRPHRRRRRRRYPGVRRVRPGHHGEPV